MKILFFITSLFFSFNTWAKTLPSLKINETTTNEFQKQSIKLFETVWKKVTTYQNDYNKQNIDLNKIYTDYLPQIKKCQSEKDLIRIINNMLKDFKQSHLALLPPENKKVTEALQRSANTRNSFDSNIKDIPSDIGVRLCLTDDNKICILKIKSNSPAQKIGLEVGDIIKSIDKYKFNTEISSQIPWYIIAQGMLQGLENTPVFITVIKANKKTKDYTLKMCATGEQWIQIGYLPKLLGEFHSEILDGNIGYIYFSPCFSQQIIKFQNAIKKMKNIKGLIVDVRNNPGGLILTSSAIAGWLSDKAIDFGKMNSNGTVLTLKSYPQADAFTGPIALLINKSTGSSAEVFAAGMQDSKRATIIGETTSGQCLPSVFLKLENDFRLQTIFGSFIRSNGGQIEKTGVIPDIKTSIKYSDLINGKDTGVMPEI